MTDQDVVLRGRVAFGLTVAAFAAAAALLAAGVLVPMYSSSSTDSSGVTTTSSATLVAENGVGVLLVLAIPMLLVVVVWAALHRRCSAGSDRSNTVAWTIVGTAGFFGFIGAASVGLFVLPIAALLAGAAALTPAGRTP